MGFKRGAAIGAMAGGSIGQMVGAQIGGKSKLDVHSGTFCPPVHLHTQFAKAPDAAVASKIADMRAYLICMGVTVKHSAGRAGEVA